MEVHPKHESDYIVGRNAVNEAIKSGRSIDSIMVSSFDGFGSIKAILAQAKDKGIVIKQVNKKVLNSISDAHQGIIAIAAAKEPCTIDDILNFVYNIRECDNYSDLQENTLLQKKLKSMLMNGKIRV